jgi:hypothetical protein
MMVAKKARAVRPGKPIPVKVAVEVTADTPYYYVNLVEVGHSSQEFCLTATRIPTKLTSAQLQQVAEGQTVVFEPTLQLIFSAPLLPALIETLQIQQKLYEDNFGPIAPSKGKHG